MPINSFPVISKIVQELISISNINQDTHFSIIREHSRIIHDGTIIPPTKTEFMREWNSTRQDFLFECNGQNLEQCKEMLKLNFFEGFQFPSHILARTLEKRIKAITWTRMIMAFNMYAAVRKEFELHPYNNIDFIGSTGDEQNLCGRNLHGHYLVFISDNNLSYMIDLIKNTETTSNLWLCPSFWQRIFDIYDGLYFNCNISNCMHRGITNNNTIQVQRVDAPTHEIAQEYLSRIDEDETAIVIDNRQIANMVMRTESPLPRNISKTIYETCMALHISHPMQEQ